MVTQLRPPRVCDEIVFSYLFTSSPAGEGNSCMSLIHCILVISTPLKRCTKFSLWIPLGGTTNCGFTEKSLGQMQWWANVHDLERVTCPKQPSSVWESKGPPQGLAVKERKKVIWTISTCIYMLFVLYLLPFSFVDMHYLKRFYIVSGERSCVYVWFLIRTIIKKNINFLVMFWRLLKGVSIC